VIVTIRCGGYRDKEAQSVRCRNEGQRLERKNCPKPLKSKSIKECGEEVINVASIINTF